MSRNIIWNLNLCSSVLRWLCTHWEWLFSGVLIIIYLKTRYFTLSHFSFIPTLAYSWYLQSTLLSRFPPAGPAQCRARGFAPQHVRGHDDQADWPVHSARGLWASPQGLNAASCWKARQAAGRGCLPKLSECVMGFRWWGEVMRQFSLLIASTVCLFSWAGQWCLRRLIMCPWLKMDPS